MNIYHIIESVSNPNAGPSYSVPSLLEKLNGISNVEAKLITTGLAEYKWKYKHEVIPMNSVAYIDLFGVTNTAKKLKSLLSDRNIIHGHGVWRPSNLIYLSRKKNDKCKMLCSPRGMLTEWAMNHRKFRKAPFWKLLQMPALQKVDCFHVTAESELEDIRRLGLRQPAAIIPNGVDVPGMHIHQKKNNQILFLSRLNKKKGLDILLESWSIIGKRYPDWNLIIAGPQYETFAKNIITETKQLQLNNIKFVGEKFNEDKINLFQSSKVFVLPSYSENFGIVVAEALANGVPVITTTGTPWSKIVDKNCGWYIEPTVDELSDALISAISKSEATLIKMGMNGRDWMERDFSWDSISRSMYQTYQWLFDRELDRPNGLILD